jgi:hypothetical protein
MRTEVSKVRGTYQIAWRGAAVPVAALALILLIAVCWSGLAGALAGSRANVYPVPRVAIQLIKAPDHPLIGETLSMTAQDLAGVNLSYSWDFGDGTQTTGPLVDHAYSASGAYTITLMATDAMGQVGQATASVTIYLPPVGASFYWTAEP